MSLDHYRESAFWFARLMREAAADIESGKRNGVRIIYPKPDFWKTRIVKWFTRRAA